MSLFALIAFAFLCAAAYYLCPDRLKWVLLLLASYAYYAYCGANALPFILLTTLSTWAGALKIGLIGEKSKAELKARKAELDAAAGVTPEPTEDNEAYRLEQEAILQMTVYSVFGSSAKYYHRDTVCETQSNRRSLTIQEAMGEGMGACPTCNPPVFMGY